jgi:hypothetical protein
MYIYMLPLNIQRIFRLDVTRFIISRETDGGRAKRDTDNYGRRARNGVIRKCGGEGELWAQGPPKSAINQSSQS